MIAIPDEVVMKAVAPGKTGVVAEGYWGNRMVYKVSFDTHSGDYKCWWKYPPGKSASGPCERRGWAFGVFATADTVPAAMEKCKEHFYVGRKVKTENTFA